MYRNIVLREKRLTYPELSYMVITYLGLRNKHPDRGSVIELLEKNALKAAFGPGNKDEMEDCYPILISFMRNLTDEYVRTMFCSSLTYFVQKEIKSK